MIVRALHAGWSDVNALQAQQAFNARIRTGQTMDAATLARARGLLEIALEWNPDNAFAVESMSLMHQLGAQLPGVGYLERQQHLDSALAYALRDVALRPTSGYAYSLVAVAKLMRGQRDSTYRKALFWAAHYAPWEPRVQQSIIEAGSEGWESLDEASRELVRQSVTRALQAYPDESVAFLLAHRWQLPNCEDLRVAIPRLCAANAGRFVPIQPGAK
jgi:hypothetical protein